MKSRFPFTGSLLISFAAFSIACINTIGLPSRPDQVPSELWEIPPPPVAASRGDIAHARAVRDFAPPLSEDLEKLAKAYRHFATDFPRRPAAERHIGGRNDYAAALLYLGRVQEAIGELEHAEKLLPGYFGTAANLGTAFELAGDLASARRWIAEGIARNAEDHRGTEWLHLAILDAKLKLQSDPSWLNHRSVLELQPARDDAATVRAIAYQMNERLNFVTADDPIIADLFYQAGIRTAHEEVREYFFGQSRRFGELRREAISPTRAGAGPAR